MTVNELKEKQIFETVQEKGNESAEITKPFCCDLLSVAMSKAPAGCAWVTIMGNINTLAVASLTEAACIVLAEGVQMDEAAVEKAAAQEIPVFCTDKPIFEAALEIERLLYG
ncbi:hypothetical protein [Anaerolentibacter hominis]|uniref:hypothetical protein n=1 Tax=Anaerolentibacter hominis TaxID=3079009 RepID=UPI0031B801E6